jgi:hypothetical protein
VEKQPEQTMYKGKQFATLLTDNYVFDGEFWTKYNRIVGESSPIPDFHSIASVRNLRIIAFDVRDVWRK